MLTASPIGSLWSADRSSTASSKTIFIKGSKPRRTPVTFLLQFSCNNNLLSIYLIGYFRQKSHEYLYFFKSGTFTLVLILPIVQPPVESGIKYCLLSMSSGQCQEPSAAQKIASVTLKDRSIYHVPLVISFL